MNYFSKGGEMQDISVELNEYIDHSLLLLLFMPQQMPDLLFRKIMTEVHKCAHTQRGTEKIVF